MLCGSAGAELEVTGVDNELEANIRAFASLAGEPCDAEDWLIQRRYRNLEREVREALEPFGYYEPIIDTSLKLESSCWQAIVKIDPGEPVRYRDVSIGIDGEAAEDPAFDALLLPAPISTGDAVRHASFDGLKRSLQILSADRGYVDAGFTDSSLEIWPELGIADATLRLDSGSRYEIGEITVEQSFLAPRIVTGLIQELRPGVPFSSDDISRAHRDLSDSGYFNRITVSPQFDDARDGRIPITIGLERGTRLEYTFGVGASTDTGLRFRAGYRNNRLNSRGHRLIADLGISPVVQGITTEYRIPLADPRREWFSIAAAVSAEETDTFESELQRIGVRWTRAISQTWLRTYSIDLTNESFDVGDAVDTRRSIVPAVAFDHKFADRDVMPRAGRRLGIEFRGTDPALGSQNDFFRTSVRARWVHSFGARNRLLVRFDAGLLTTSSFERLPPSIRFFAGGDESVRGFDYESLGPKDQDGNVIGGRRLAVASIEYERRLKGNWYGALFLDAGNAFNGSEFDAAVGTGPGLKWVSPLGPIRAYIGVPLTGDDDGIRFHLRLGADL
jgi:translocation and assembly module TamA